MTLAVSGVKTERLQLVYQRFIVRRAKLIYGAVIVSQLSPTSAGESIHC